MRTRRVALLVGFVFALVVAFVAGAWAQQTHKVIWHWPDSMDAVNSAPKIHKVLFENDHIRLLEVTVPAGTTEPIHGHKYPSVFAFDAVQPKLKDHQLEPSTDNSGNPLDPNSKTQAPHRLFEDSDWYAPQCITMGPQAPHQVTILDTFPQHFYRLEFKKMDGQSIEKMAHYPNQD